MTYLRTTGRTSGRICGQGGRARMLGDIAGAGAGPDITGDPSVALIAQLNRFAGRQVTVGGKSRTYLDQPLPLATGALSDKAATTAVLILYDRYQYGTNLLTYDAKKAAWANAALTGDTSGFVMSNLSEITQTIALFGDSLGLAPSTIGVTGGPNIKWPSGQPVSWTDVIVYGGALAAAYLIFTRRKARR